MRLRKRAADSSTELTNRTSSVPREALGLPCFAQLRERRAHALCEGRARPESRDAGQRCRAQHTKRERESKEPHLHGDELMLLLVVTLVAAAAEQAANEGRLLQVLQRLVQRRTRAYTSVRAIHVADREKNENALAARYSSPPSPRGFSQPSPPPDTRRTPHVAA